MKSKKGSSLHICRSETRLIGPWKKYIFNATCNIHLYMHCFEHRKFCLWFHWFTCENVKSLWILLVDYVLCTDKFWNAHITLLLFVYTGMARTLLILLRLSYFAFHYCYVFHWLSFFCISLGSSMQLLKTATKKRKPCMNNDITRIVWNILHIMHLNIMRCINITLLCSLHWIQVSLFRRQMRRLMWWWRWWWWLVV